MSEQETVNPRLDALDTLDHARYKLIALTELLTSDSDSDMVVIDSGVRSGLYYLLRTIIDEIDLALDKLKGELK